MSGNSWKDFKKEKNCTKIASMKISKLLNLKTKKKKRLTLLKSGIKSESLLFNYTNKDYKGIL